MIENKSAAELRTIATGGGSLHVNGQRLAVAELRSIATGLMSGAMLIVSNSSHFSSAEMRSVATGSSDGASVLFQ
jgi:hypothetical protein